jgi:nucleolar protein 14
MQDLTSVLLDHILYVSGERPSAIMVVDAILPHFVELSKAYPIRSAEDFVRKLKVMQKNLNRGLQDPLSPSSRTFPGVPELILLRVLGGIWSTSDMKHPVVGPARYLMCAYLGLSRIRSLADIASGLFLCTLFYEASVILSPRDISSSVYSMSEIQSDSFQRLSTFLSTLRSY